MLRSNQGGIGGLLDGKMSVKLRERAEQALAKVLLSVHTAAAERHSYSTTVALSVASYICVCTKAVAHSCGQS